MRFNPKTEGVEHFMQQEMGERRKRSAQQELDWEAPGDPGLPEAPLWFSILFYCFLPITIFVLLSTAYAAFAACERSALCDCQGRCKQASIDDSFGGRGGEDQNDDDMDSMPIWPKRELQWPPEGTCMAVPPTSSLAYGLGGPDCGAPTKLPDTPTDTPKPPKRADTPKLPTGSSPLGPPKARKV